MTPPRTEFMAALEREKERRVKERTIKRRASGRVYNDYRYELFNRTVAQRKGER